MQHVIYLSRPIYLTCWHLWGTNTCWYDMYHKCWYDMHHKCWYPTSCVDTSVDMTCMTCMLIKVLIPHKHLLIWHVRSFLSIHVHLSIHIYCYYYYYYYLYISATATTTDIACGVFCVCVSVSTSIYTALLLLLLLLRYFLSIYLLWCGSVTRRWVRDAIRTEWLLTYTYIHTHENVTYIM